MYLRTCVTQADLRRLAEEQSQLDLLPEDRTRLHTAAQHISNRRNFGCILGLGLGLLVAHRAQIDRKAVVAASKTAKDLGRGAQRKVERRTGSRDTSRQPTMSVPGRGNNVVQSITGSGTMCQKNVMNGVSGSGNNIVQSITGNGGMFRMNTVYGEGSTAEMTASLSPIARNCLSTLFWSGIGLTTGGHLGLRIGSVGAIKLISEHPDSMERIESAFHKFKVQALMREAYELSEGKGVVGELFTQPRWVALEKSGLGIWWVSVVKS